MMTIARDDGLSPAEALDRLVERFGRWRIALALAVGMIPRREARVPLVLSDRLARDIGLEPPFGPGTSLALHRAGFERPPTIL